MTPAIVAVHAAGNTGAGGHACVPSRSNVVTQAAWTASSSVLASVSKRYKSKMLRASYNESTQQSDAGVKGMPQTGPVEDQNVLSRRLAHARLRRPRRQSHRSLTSTNRRGYTEPGLRRARRVRVPLRRQNRLQDIDWLTFAPKNQIDIFAGGGSDVMSQLHRKSTFDRVLAKVACSFGAI